MEYSDEQKDIIETDSSIVISAGAGSGKTRTLVEKIKHDINKYRYETHKIVAAITFTIKATNEIKSRLSISNNDEVYVSTNNQFVINEIIKPFARDYYGEEFSRDFDVNYSKKMNTYELCLEELKLTGKICSLRDNKKNFVFQLALTILKNSAVARLYITSKYCKWFIDEYQDTDDDMHNFFMYAHEELKIDLFIVGDEKQNIYFWRGANSQNFKDLFDNEDFLHKKLTNNFRSLQQIQNLSNLLNLSTQKLIKETEGELRNVFIRQVTSSDNKIEIISNGIKHYKSPHIAVLCRTNVEAKRICKELNNREHNFIYVPTTPIDDITSASSWLYFGVAKYCLLNKNVFDFIEYIPVEIVEKNNPLKSQFETILKEIHNNKTNENEFILSFKKLSTLIESEADDDNIKKLLLTINDPSNSIIFYDNDRSNQVSTVHKSKGKEFDLVFIFSDDFYDFGTEERVNNLYVAITRAKNQLVIINTINSRLINFINGRIKDINKNIKDFYYPPLKSIQLDKLDV